MSKFYKPTSEDRHWTVVSLPGNATPPKGWVPLDTSPPRRNAVAQALAELWRNVTGLWAPLVVVLWGLLIAAIVLAVFSTPPARAQTPELEYLSDLNAAGFVVYDTETALNTARWVCGQLDTRNGADVVRQLYIESSWTDLPTPQDAFTVMIAAVVNLCPWHYHPERIAAV